MAAIRAAQGLPPVAMTDPVAIAAGHDPRAQRLAAAIKREVDRSPPLSGEQIEQTPRPAALPRRTLG